MHVLVARGRTKHFHSHVATRTRTRAAALNEGRMSSTAPIEQVPRLPPRNELKRSLSTFSDRAPPNGINRPLVRLTLMRVGRNPQRRQPWTSSLTAIPRPRCPDDFHALCHLAKHHVLVVQPVGLHRA